MYKIFTLLLVLLFAWELSAQNKQRFTISGYVEDSETGERLIGVNVFDAKSGEGTITNTYGFYSLTLPKDSVYLAVSYIGMETQYYSLLLDKDAEMGIKLAPAALETVVVTAADSEDRIEERNQMSQINIPIEQIKSLPAFLGEVDVLKVLQLLPGVQSGEGTSGLYVRGGSPDQNLILLDGVPVYNVFHLFGFFSVFNADAIKSVQLTKGGYPARFGGRLSSVLEINMKEGNLKKWSGEGSIGLISSKITLEAPIQKDKTSFMVSARRTYIDILTQPLIMLAAQAEGSASASVGYYFYDVNAKVNHIFNQKNRLYLSFYGGSDKFYANVTDRYTDINTGTTYTDKLRSKIAWGNITSSLRWNRVVSKKMFANTNLTFSRYNFVIGISQESKSNSGNPNDYMYYEAAYRSGIADAGAKIDFDYIINPRNYMRFGANAIYHTFNPGATVLKLDESGQDTSIQVGNNKVYSGEYAAYVENDMRLTENMGMNVGVHASAMSVEGRFYQSVQPRVNVRYLLPQKVAIKASFTTMTQYIHLLTNEGLGLPTDLWVPSTRNIAPERAWQGALGVSKTVNKKYEVSIEAYYKKMYNLLSYKPGASFLNSDTDSWETKVEAEGVGWSYGAELFVQKKTGKFTGWVSYTLAWNWRQFANTDINFGRPYPFKYDRRHNFAITGNYDLNDKISMSAVWVYGTGNSVTLPTETYLSPNNGSVDAISDKNSFRMRAYHRLDFSINIKKQLKRILSTWSFGAYNVYNRQNPFYIYATNNLNTGAREFKQVSLFPFIPSVRWDFKF